MPRASSASRGTRMFPSLGLRPTVRTDGWSGKRSQSFVTPSPSAPAPLSPTEVPYARAAPIAATRPSWRRRPSRYGVGPRCAAFRVRTKGPSGLRVEPEQLRPLEQLADAPEELHRQLAVDHAVIETD